MCFIWKWNFLTGKSKRKPASSIAICDIHLKPRIGYRNDAIFKKKKSIQSISKLYFFNLKNVLQL